MSALDSTTTPPTVGPDTPSPLLSRGRRILLAATTALLSAALFRFGTGLEPLPWLTWLAPLPVLLLAPRIGARWCATVAFAAWLGGETGVWTYYRDEDKLMMPLPAALGILVGTAAIFALVVLLVRRLLLRRRFALAASALPAAWAALEWVVSAATPNGAFWSLAYTQADVLPVLQTASATGPWGITFLVLGVPAVVATCLAPAITVRSRWIVGAVAGVVLAGALGYGVVRLNTTGGSSDRVKVGLVSTSRDAEAISVATTRGRALLTDYLAQIGRLADRGARVVLLSENAFEADERTLPELSGPLAALAVERRVDIVVGVRLTTGGALYNTALDFPAGGGAPVSYRKHHMVPGQEDEFTAGEGVAFMAGTDTRVGLTICKDMDFPGLMREYGDHGTRLLLAPAWDFGTDGWLHSRMALTRGVENGFAVARTARRGALVVSDLAGRVIADSTTGGRAPFTTALADVELSGSRTLYTRLGDWFAWVAIAVFAATVIGAFTGNGRSTRRH
ncbi:hypothetical protein B4N89_46960 [Embleya scabrispora]|uniref:CN hydrolase domain-containing protein n=1 Tax=Embleya scabrispora TaxID=159449 RepID=A0A1T3NIL0_9ACTN|nr:nitrilase-related carbon-nitrogen hydrolase [Embleya scabrispora]OPC76555.1 hypothetical protein B4N89_46960 [Embleya scabrispora]